MSQVLRRSLSKGIPLDHCFSATTFTCCFDISSILKLGIDDITHGGQQETVVKDVKQTVIAGQVMGLLPNISKRELVSNPG